MEGSWNPQRRTGPVNEDEKNKLEDLKVIIVVEGDAEYIKKS